MPTCFVPSCEHSDKNSKCKWLRFPRKNVHKNAWIRQIGRFRVTEKLSRGSMVCTCHFVDGKRENGPTIFSWTNKLVSDASEKLPEAALLDDDSNKSRWNLRVRRPQNYALKDTIECDEEVIPNEKLHLNKRSVSCDSKNSPSSSQLVKRRKLNATTGKVSPFENVTTGATKKIKIERKSAQLSIGNDVTDNENDLTFKNLLDDVLTSSKWGIQKLNNGIIISQIEFVGGVLQLRKCIIIENNSATIYFDRNKLTTEIFNSRTELTNLLCRVDNQKVCPGGPLFSIYDPPIWNPTIAFTDADYNRWRHKKCIYLFDGQEQSCSFCLKLFESFLRRQRRLKLSQQQKIHMKKMIRDKFECVKEKSCSLDEIKQEKCDDVDEKLSETGKEVNLIQMKNIIRNKFLCIKEKGGLIDEPIESNDPNVDLLQMKNVIQNKFNCIKDQNIQNTPECEMKSVNLVQMKNMIKNKFASIKEKSHLLQETNDLGLKSSIKEEKIEDVD